MTRTPDDGTGPAPAGAAVPPAWGWKIPGSGRAAHVDGGPRYQATSTQACGLYPFAAGAGTPTAGTPVGRHLLTGEIVCLDPMAWLRAGLVTNPGMFVLGEPGAGKSTLVKRLATGAVARGEQVLVLGDTKPDYVLLAEHLGGQVIRAGRGTGRINPLDPGPLAAALAGAYGAAGETLRREVRARRISLLMALCTLVRGASLTNAEEVILGRAVDLLDDAGGVPTIPEVLAVIEQKPVPLWDAARAGDLETYGRRTEDLVFTLDLLCTGTLAGVFDGPSAVPADPDAPMIVIDISAAGAAGDTLTAAAMLCAWAAGFGTVDAAAARAAAGGPRRGHLVIMDELWRALRGAPGLVEHADALTRLNRSRGMASVMITHSLADLDALPTPEDRAKARGFIDRAAITVMAALPPRELAQVRQVTPLTGPEHDLVASWAAPDSWQPGARHPGRGRYLLKAGARIGIPAELTLTPQEAVLYDTDQAIRAGGTR